MIEGLVRFIPSMIKEIRTWFLISFLAGAILIIISGYIADLFLWLLCLIGAFSFSFVFMFRKPEIRREFKGDQ
jgi:Flp pilus assembly protein TadB